MKQVTPINLLTIFAQLQNEFKNVKLSPLKVLSLSTEFINSSPESESRLKEVYLIRGFGYYYTNDFDSALGDLERCDEYNVANFYKLRGMILNNKNFKNYNCYQAINEFTKAIELDRRNHELYYLRALAYINYEDYNKAKSDLDLALKIDVTNNEYYYQRGIVNYKLNNNNESVEDLEMAIKNGFKDDIATLHYQLSLAYYNLNNFQRAIQAIDKAIKADESNYEYRELKFKIVIDRETLQLKTQISHLDHEVADKNKLIEALESKNKIQEQLYTATNISEAFAERAKRHKDVKEEFLMLSVGWAVLALIGYMIFSFIPFPHWWQHYLLAPVFLCVEVFLLDGYRRNLKFQLFYLHKKTVVLSMEKIGTHYFNLEDDKDKKNYRNFALEQYKDLYQPPSFIDKKSLLVKHGSSEIKIDADGNISKKASK